MSPSVDHFNQRLMCMTSIDVCRLFNEENPDNKIKKSKFASLRPMYIFPVDDTFRNVSKTRIKAEINDN
jgi:hypothetical protein